MQGAQHISKTQAGVAPLAPSKRPLPAPRAPAVYASRLHRIMLQMLAIGGGLMAAAVLMLALGGAVAVLAGLLLAAALLPLALGFSLLAYARAGQRRVRRLLLGAVPWSGDEQVLDLDAGNGLMLIGAARRLRSGHAVGLGAWWRTDPAGQRRAAIADNAAREGVAPNITLRTGDVRALPMPDGAFDRIIAFLCLHHLADDRQRETAAREIARVLRPGGTLLVGDYVPLTAHAVALDKAGLQVRPARNATRAALTPMWILVAEKPPLTSADGDPGMPASAAPPDPAPPD